MHTKLNIFCFILFIAQRFIADLFYKYMNTGLFDTQIDFLRHIMKKVHKIEPREIA